jgi:Saxitoxin biosynthesis operon protein SxtJ
MSETKTVHYFPKTISKQQASDTGQAMVLILLLIGFFTKNDLYYKIAIPALVMNMAWPKFYHYFAIVWLGLSQILGTFVSKILLSVVYALVVFPVAVFRRLAGKDSLQLKSFKKDSSSVMVTRDHEFTSADIDKPY